MKLRNKKTGEIKTAYVQVIVENNHPAKPLEYDTQLSLSELNEEWEDYEEPKEWWFIDSGGEVVETTYITDYDKTNLRNFGNYFETKEEAEKAVEKLKAWKRLKDKGFKFNGETCDYKADKHFGSVFFETDGYLLDVYEDTSEFYDDLELLFGGEE